MFYYLVVEIKWCGDCHGGSLIVLFISFFFFTIQDYFKCCQFSRARHATLNLVENKKKERLALNV